MAIEVLGFWQCIAQFKKNIFLHNAKKTYSTTY
jgi:hypothetical protein